MKSAKTMVSVLGLLALTLCGCDRSGSESGGAKKAGSDAPVADGSVATPTEAEAELSGPLPPRTIELAVTTFEPEIIGTIYASDFQDLILDRWDAEGAAGRYAFGQGYFEGVRESGSDGPEGIDRIEGYWHQPAGETRCETARDGSHYWGRFQFNFPHGRQQFIGFWGKCDATPLDRWNGEFVRRDAETAATVAALQQTAG